MEVKATVLFEVLSFFVPISNLFFGFLFRFFVFYSFFCPVVAPFTRLARPRFGKCTGNFSQVFLNS